MILEDYRKKIESLAKIASGSNREVFKRLSKEKGFTAVLKTQNLSNIHRYSCFNHDAFEDRAKILEIEQKAQLLAKEVFGDMYLASRFIKIVDIENQWKLISFERYLPDIYSDINEGSIDLAFDSFLAFEEDRVTSEKIEQITALFSDKQLDLAGILNENTIEKLSSVRFDLNLLNTFFKKIRNYNKQGYVLDLIGKNNVIYYSKSDIPEIIINNSAVKSRKTIYKEVLENDIEDDFCSSYKGYLFLSEIVGMVKINIICDITRLPRLYKLKQLQIEKLQNILISF